MIKKVKTTTHISRQKCVCSLCHGRTVIILSHFPGDTCSSTVQSGDWLSQGQWIQVSYNKMWKWGPNEDHFSSLVLMRTKSSIEDFYGSTDECFQVANKVLTCIGKILHRTRQPCPHWSMSWKKKFSGNCLIFDYEKSLTHCVVFLEGSRILAANFVGGRSWPTSLQIRFKKLQIAN